MDSVLKANRHSDNDVVLGLGAAFDDPGRLTKRRQLSAKGTAGSSTDPNLNQDGVFLLPSAPFSETPGSFDGSLAHNPAALAVADRTDPAHDVPTTTPSAHAAPTAADTTPLIVHANAVLEIDHGLPGSATIRFDGQYGTLKLDAPGSMAATISGFTGVAPVAGQSDVIDLVGVGTLSNANLSYAVTTGILTVTGNTGVPIAALHLSGDYTIDSFKVAADGSGGTNIFDPTTNPIVLENQLPGTPQSVWAINGNINNKGNDAAIEGFATSMSIAPGQTENFKILTGSTQYRIDIYRLGYYGGNGARLVSTQTVNLTKAQAQPTALFDPATNQVDAGNWSVSASWAVPTTAVSGVYFAKLTTLNGVVGQNMIPFVVNGGGAPSDITFQTNDFNVGGL